LSASEKKVNSDPTPIIAIDRISAAGLDHSKKKIPAVNFVRPSWVVLHHGKAVSPQIECGMGHIVATLKLSALS
jgi:hypothetical protein